MTWLDLWALLWPGWGAVWPNILASLIWSPAVGVLAWLWRRAHKRRHAEITAMVSDLHDTVRSQGGNGHEYLEDQ